MRLLVPHPPLLLCGGLWVGRAAQMGLPRSEQGRATVPVEWFGMSRAAARGGMETVERRGLAFPCTDVG